MTRKQHKEPPLHNKAVTLALAGTLLGAATIPASPFSDDHPIRRVPTVIQVDAQTLPEAKLLGTPEVRTLLGYTRRPLHLPDGHTMALFSFSSSAPANWLFLIDCRDMSVTRHAIPNNDIASHGAALGRDGHIYIMPYGKGRAYQFDTVSKAFTELVGDVPEEQYTWDAIGGKNGRIYFGTYPGAWFGEYDPTSGQWEVWEGVVPNTKYVASLSVLDDGRISFKASGPDEVWMTFDPDTRAFEHQDGRPASSTGAAHPALPELAAPGDTFERPVKVGDRWFTVSRISSRLLELFPERPPREIGELRAKAETLWWLKVQPHALAGVGYYGAWFHYNLETDTLRQGQLDNRAPGGNAIMFVEAVSPECVVGANYSQQNLFTVNPRTGDTMSSLAKISSVTGEAMCAVGLKGSAYLGIYVESVLAEYDPKQPLAYGTNPREFAHLGTKYAQTRPRAAVTDGIHVIMSSDSAYNKLGGALAIYEPDSETLAVYHHLIPDQNLPTLVYDAAQGYLWGGTDRWGQMKSAPPTQESALIYAFDMATRQVVHTLIPWPGADRVDVHAIGSGGVLLASHDGQVACIDSDTLEVLYKGAWPVGLHGRWERGADGLHYGLTMGHLYRWSATTNTLRAVGITNGCTRLTESEPNTWTVADGTSVYRLKLQAVNSK